MHCAACQTGDAFVTIVGPLGFIDGGPAFLEGAGIAASGGFMSAAVAIGSARSGAPACSDRTASC
jgi:hypothetical protein